MTMSAETAEAEPDLDKKAAKAIHKHIQSKTEDIDLEKYEEVNAEMAITQICGLARIHRQTWYDNGVIYRLQEKYKSLNYEKGDGVVIDAKKFLEEFNQ